jgi:hypothetical protein
MLSAKEAKKIADEAQSVELAEINQAIMEAASKGYFLTIVYVTKDRMRNIANKFKDKGFSISLAKPEKDNGLIIGWDK